MDGLADDEMVRPWEEVSQEEEGGEVKAENLKSGH